ncbi:hypothetical protein LWI29_003668 [Acer saccharum]|uniref:Uncharacterized protein n=1 Tax=Acer saccharum TaxID=4024 RepID=A0AA39STM8_ACESA|nr:hypothetical protein LWI29_003668 [Acer saccharum]
MAARENLIATEAVRDEAMSSSEEEMAARENGLATARKEAIASGVKPMVPYCHGGDAMMMVDRRDLGWIEEGEEEEIDQRGEEEKEDCHGGDAVMMVDRRRRGD